MVSLTPPVLAARLDSEVRRRLHSAAHPVSEVRVQRLRINAMTTLVANLEFAFQSSRRAPSEWRALLLVRADLLWKRRVTLPSPHELTHEIVVPWRADVKNLSSAEPWLNDVLFFLPSCRVFEFWRYFVHRFRRRPI